MPEVHRVMISCIYNIGSGLRISELINLEWNDIRWNQLAADEPIIEVLIKNSKRGRSRVVPMAKESALALIDYAEKVNAIGYSGFPEGGRIFAFGEDSYKKDLKIIDIKEWKFRYVRHSYNWIRDNIFKKYFKQIPNKNITPHSLRHCVKEDCEILTSSGWKKYNEVEVGNIVYSYNIEKDIIEKDTINNLNIYNFNGELNNINNLYLDYSFTDEHKLIINIQKFNYRKNDIKGDWMGYRLLKLSEINNIKSKRLMKHKISSSYNGELSIGIEKAGILGWILTDGKMSNRKLPEISISQSISANKNKCKYIEKLLIKANISFSMSNRITRSSYGECSMNNYQILKGGNHSSNPDKMGKNHDWIYEFLNKDRTPKWKLLNLKKEELKELYKCMMMGDGTRGQEFCNQNIKTIEFFRVLASFLGKNTSIGKKIQNNKEYYRTYIQNRDYVNILPKSIGKVLYNGIIWCPETNNKTFIAKSNNKIFITGNSRATELLNDHNVSIEKISEWLGHDDISTTMLYLRMSNKDDRKLMGKIGGV